MHTLLTYWQTFMAVSKQNLKAHLILSLAASLLLGISASALALQNDHKQPLDVESDQFHSDQQKNLTVLSGNVRFTQGSIKGHSDKATLTQDSTNKITRIVLTGSPAQMEQRLDNGGGMMRARATTIDYHADTNTVDMRGDVHVMQENRGEFRGEHLVYNTQTGEMVSGNEQSNGRVRLHILPKNTADKDATSDSTLEPPK